MRTDSRVVHLGLILLVYLALLAWLLMPNFASAQEVNREAPLSVGQPAAKAAASAGASGSAGTSSAGTSAGAQALPTITAPSVQLPDLTKRENFSSALQLIILLTVLSLAPAILIMMTSFTRIVIVLSLLRQALGTQQLPPNQVLVGLALFMTFLVMGPTLQRVNDEALQPYMSGQLEQREAMQRAVVPLRDFMIRQIETSRGEENVLMFQAFAHKPPPQKWEDVGTMTLIPSFVLCELKTAFLMGFKIYLPFLIIDVVISSILISMGMMMLPPVMISLPFKLLLFVLVDGWHLITQNLIVSFGVT